MMPSETLQECLTLKLLSFAGMLQCNRGAFGAPANLSGSDAIW